MKALVIKGFRDEETLEHRKAGKVIDISEERFEAVSKKGDYLKKLEEIIEEAGLEVIEKEPVAEEPVAEEPVAEEPVDEEPVAEEPVDEEPAPKKSTRGRKKATDK